ncbi:MAG: uncharacterized protein JWL91_2499 [Sphingomonas bacterium]|nr:hypothetical protein [Sphingomonas bacterium]MDB5690623.1 uncharacterized protein [Sphingomonas bacterium]
MRTVLMIVGVVFLLMGILWMAQGSGIFPYPRSSFMIDQRPWITRGLMLAIAGAAIVLISRRVGRRRR